MRHEDNTCEAREANVERLWQCEEVTCGKAFQSAHLLDLHRHAVHVRGAEVRGMLSEIGINTMPLDGSTAVKAKFRSREEDRENDRSNRLLEQSSRAMLPRQCLTRNLCESQAL